MAYLLVMAWSGVPFLPGEPMLVAAGSWSAAGGPLLAGVVVAATVGSFTSDLAKYAIGRKAGPSVLHWLEQRPAGARAVAWIGVRMARSGAAVIVPSYFVPFGVVASTLLAGALRLPLREVMVASAVGAAVWAGVFATLGYVGGAVTGSPLVGIALALPAALAVGVLAGRRTTHRTPTGT